MNRRSVKNSYFNKYFVKKIEEFKDGVAITERDDTRKKIIPIINEGKKESESSRYGRKKGGKLCPEGILFRRSGASIPLEGLDKRQRKKILKSTYNKRHRIVLKERKMFQDQVDAKNTYGRFGACKEHQQNSIYQYVEDANACNELKDKIEVMSTKNDELSPNDSEYASIRCKDNEEVDVDDLDTIDMTDFDVIVKDGFSFPMDMFGDNESVWRSESILRDNYEDIIPGDIDTGDIEESNLEDLNFTIDLQIEEVIDIDAYEDFYGNLSP